jgi:hypothetical protein
MDFMNILLELLDKPIAFQRSFLKIGNANTALFLSQCFHWQKHTKDEFDGWFCRTIEQFEHEMGLTRREQESVKKTLKAKGILHTEMRGAPAKLWMKLDLDLIYQILTDSDVTEKTPSKPAQKRHASLHKNAIQGCTKTPCSIYKEDKELGIRISDKNYINKNDEKNFLDFSEVEDLEDCDKIQITKQKFEKLKNEYGYETLKNVIIQLDTHITNNPKKYKDHNKTLTVWMKNAVKWDLNGRASQSKGVGGKNPLRGGFEGNGGNLNADGSVAYSDFDKQLIEEANKKKMEASKNEQC